MAGSNRNKKKGVRQLEKPFDRSIRQAEDPNNFYGRSPAWGFGGCDLEMWPLIASGADNSHWDNIISHFRAWESQTWSDILVTAKEQNHSIDTRMLNPRAQKRLQERRIEQDSIISLRLSGKQRIYGYMVGSVFNIVWYDPDHGDNERCVCRSHKKYT